MKINNKGNFSIFRDLIEIFFDVSRLMQIFSSIASMPPAIKIKTMKISSVIAGCDSIGIDHGYNFKLIIFPQIFALFVLSQQEVDESLANKGAWSLPRMLSW